MGLRGAGVGLYSRGNAILHSSSRLPFYSHSHPTDECNWSRIAFPESVILQEDEINPDQKKASYRETDYSKNDS